MLTTYIEHRVPILLFIILIFCIRSNSYSQDLAQIQIANEYYSLGEIDKAIELYQKISRNQKNIPLIHNNYFDLLLSTGDYKSAEKYIDQQIKRRPDNIYFAIDKGILFSRKGDINQEESYYKKLFTSIEKDDRKTRQAAQYLIVKQKLDFAEELYLRGRKANKDPYR